MRTKRSAVLTGLVALGLAVMIGGAAAQQPAQGQAPPAGGRGRGLASLMTGKIEVGDTKNMNMSRIRFEAGARTNWHHHPLGQTLHVTAGCGWFRTKGEARVTIRAGDTVWIPPGEIHWHGATDTTTMTHIAIQERVGESHGTWLEPVADEDYLAG